MTDSLPDIEVLRKSVNDKSSEDDKIYREIAQRIAMDSIDIYREHAYDMAKQGKKMIGYNAPISEKDYTSKYDSGAERICSYVDKTLKDMIKASNKSRGVTVSSKEFYPPAAEKSRHYAYCQIKFSW